ncbi:hypothetical protein M0E87_00965 [Corynebacterium sp. CCM 9185]|uniref:Uncharacterized protein n=1 Tax=Corynebacterium marambiense TaxID=2765364 RepID=A0ABS0VSX5_9CORY|nr:hypothetical protein [Corynebacterium marambiense]MBI8999404.1 hypothetical protein [Corynebacterium marambiense]MCK7662242.1 hypothetical protein [Corynebacterium marambiense]
MQAPDLTGLDRPARVRALKSALATMDGGGGGAGTGRFADLCPVRSPGPIDGDRPHPVPGKTARDLPGVIPVPTALANLLPGGGIPRRSITAVGDCPALIVELIATATADGCRVAVVGWPDLLLTGVADAGGVLDAVVVIPDPGDRPLSVTGMLVEGMDLVIHHGSGDARVSATQARPLLARVRRGTAALLTVGAHVPSPAIRIGADIVTYHGISVGFGRIRGFDIDVEITTKSAPPHRVLLRVGCGPVTGTQAAAGPGDREAGLRVVRAG